VFINLLVNAQDAIVVAEDGAREIWIETSHPDPSSVVVAIRDSGVGVDEAALRRLFEHFVSTKPQGLGLGLVISRSIIEAHGGRIWATRNATRGLTLHVQLPTWRSE
jgi:two-component system sensor kinase FixL